MLIVTYLQTFTTLVLLLIQILGRAHPAPIALNTSQICGVERTLNGLIGEVMLTVYVS